MDKGSDDEYWNAKWLENFIRSDITKKEACNMCYHLNSALCPCAKKRWIKQQKMQCKALQPSPAILVREFEKLARDTALKIHEWDQNQNCNRQRYEHVSRQYFFYCTKIYTSANAYEYERWLKTFRDFVENELPE